MSVGDRDDQSKDMKNESDGILIENKRAFQIIQESLDNLIFIQKEFSNIINPNSEINKQRLSLKPQSLSMYTIWDMILSYASKNNADKILEILSRKNDLRNYFELFHAIEKKDLTPQIINELSEPIIKILEWLKKELIYTEKHQD